MKRTAILLLASALMGSGAVAQTKASLPRLPAPQAVPKPAADTSEPYAPQAILPGGIVVPLFPPNSPYLKADKIHVPEVYRMSQTVHGRISSIVSIHNPSIEIHMVEKAINTGTAVIVIAGGGHRTLNVGGRAPTSSPSSTITESTRSFFGTVCVPTATFLRSMLCTMHSRPSGSSGPTPKNGGSTPVGLASWASLPAPSSPLPPPFFTKTGTRKTAIPPTRSPASPRARLRRHYLPRPDALCPQPHCTAYSQRRSTRLSGLW